MESRQVIETVAKACDDKRAEGIVVLDMKEVSLIADYFLICEASNERQVQAIAREVKDVADSHNIDIKRMEGFDQARWVLVDLGDIVCHIFHREERSYYNLEKLWGDAPQLEVNL
ncbi:ribosome-associated protein [Gracilibacillus halotolerans]|uniref:Ribosomal silencing factor RsfS n=1 Tax=Gracilibacillus halotolerans TaxID=74386 RepID=A0A841RGV1_9BACI|nr:ribosome silencing factor [Gracilibacillus halotolerans]MBB6511871.1 ribosome-associated protein [Gracilibacillus halotolerans]